MRFPIFKIPIFKTCTADQLMVFPYNSDESMSVYFLNQMRYDVYMEKLSLKTSPTEQYRVGSQKNTEAQLLKRN